MNRSFEINIVGMTDQQEAYIASRDRKFRVNEFLIIEDRNQGDIIGEIVEVHSCNKFIPLDNNGTIYDGKIEEGLRSLGFNLDEETVYIGKIRLIDEGSYPIETGSTCRIPKFDEIKKFFITTDLDKGLIMGGIRNTEDVYLSMDDDYKDLYKTLENGEIQGQKDVPYIFDLFSMHEYPHIGLFGGSGSGKSFGLRVLLEELMIKRIPTVVLDPHFEMDFANSIQDYYGIIYDERYDKFTIGKNIGIDFTSLNTSELKNLLSTSARLTDSMENVVDNLHKPKDSQTSFKDRIDMLMKGQSIGSEMKIYEEIKNSEGQEKKYYENVKKVYMEYNDKCPQPSVNGVFWRFDRLVKQGVFNFNTSNCEKMLGLSKMVVIQGSTKLIQVFSTYLINRLYKKRREYKDALANQLKTDYFPPFVIATDEAHNFAPKATDGQKDVPSKGVIKEIAQEGRKYGVFLILATQRPSLLDSTITAQLNTKLIFRTTRATDIDTIKEETDISYEQAKRLPYLKTGDVFMSEAAYGRTMYVRIRCAHTNTPHKDNPFEELRAISTKDTEDFYSVIEGFLPINQTDFYHVAREIEETKGITYGVDYLVRQLDRLVDNNLIVKESLFGDVYRKKD